MGLDYGWCSSRLLACGLVFGLEHLGITAEIDEFFVLPTQRVLGIGAKLLNAANLESRKLDCTNCLLLLDHCGCLADSIDRVSHVT